MLCPYYDLLSEKIITSLPPSQRTLVGHALFRQTRPLVGTTEHTNTTTETLNARTLISVQESVYDLVSDPPPTLRIHRGKHDKSAHPPSMDTRLANIV